MGGQVQMHGKAFGRAVQKGRYLQRVVGPLLVITYALFPWTDSPCCQEALLFAGSLWFLYATFHLPYDFLHELQTAGAENTDDQNGNG